ncbi:MAG TPA: hypothetical protein P5526_28790, partial [Anaerolineae bacterium]|nr:hypothetical protein [Anaerolineae bacterium]
MSSNGQALQHFAKTITQRFPLPRRNYPVRQMKNVGRQGMILVGETEAPPTVESNPGWLEAMPSFDEVRRRFETGRQQSPHEETKPTRPGPVGPPEIQRTSTESNPDWLEAMPSFDEVRRRFEAAKVHTPVSGTPLSLQAGAKQTPSGQRSSTLPRTTPPVLPRKPTGNRRVVSRVQEVTSGKQAGPQADLSGQTGDSPHIGPSSEPANVLPETAPKLEASPVQTQSVQTQSVQTTPPDPAILPSGAITSEVEEVGPTDAPPAALLVPPSSRSDNTQPPSQTKPTQQPDWSAAISSKSKASRAVQRSSLKPPGTPPSES